MQHNVRVEVVAVGESCSRLLRDSKIPGIGHLTFHRGRLVTCGLELATARFSSTLGGLAMARPSIKPYAIRKGCRNCGRQSAAVSPCVLWNSCACKGSRASIVCMTYFGGDRESARTGSAQVVLFSLKVFLGNFPSRVALTQNFHCLVRGLSSAFAQHPAHGNDEP